VTPDLSAIPGMEAATDESGYAEIVD